MDTTLTTGTEAVEALARALEPHTGPGWLPGTFTTDWVGASQSEAVASGAGRVIAALRADPAAARAVRDAIDPDGLRTAWSVVRRGLPTKAVGPNTTAMLAAASRIDAALAGACPDHDPNSGPGSDWCPNCGRYALLEGTPDAD